MFMWKVEAVVFNFYERPLLSSLNKMWNLLKRGGGA